MGLLTITNVILDTNHFWPGGTSDADTVLLDASAAKFVFKPGGTAAPVTTNVFLDASVSGNYGKKLCISAKKRQMRVRIQGVDAPELHYPPSLPGNWKKSGITQTQHDKFYQARKEFRQGYGEEATQALWKELNPAGLAGLKIPVRFETQVALPNDVCDLYGRFVGEVIVPRKGKPDLRIGQWLLENGWAFPSYYESMDASEIAAFDKAWKKGYALPGRPWKSGFQYKIPPFNPKMVYSSKQAGAVQGKRLTNPKIFRRQAEWWVKTKAKIHKGGLVDFLVEKEEKVYMTDEFIRHGKPAPKYDLAEFVTSNGTLNFDPECLVYTEKATNLRDGANQAITSWVKQPLGQAAASNEQPPEWSVPLSATAWVNSVAISDNASRVVGASYIYDYPNKAKVEGRYGTFAFDSTGKRLWADEYDGLSGVFAVSVSGDGSVAASGGWYDEANGILRAFDAATGQQLLDNTKIPARVSGVSLSRDGNILAAAADKVYVYKRSGSGYISLNPADSSWDMDGSVKAVAVHPDGSWLVGCDMKGNVLMVTLAGGKVQGTHDWQAPEQPIDRINNPTALAPLPFLSVAIAGESDIFAVGGGDFVYLFTKKGMIQKQPKTEFDTWDGNAPAGRQNGGAAQNVRWLALSAKGELLAVVANREINKQGTGVLLAYRQGGGQPDWRLELPRNPNGISTDAAGNYVGVADGYPLGDPAAFFMFDSDGQELWHYPTIDMNWPIAISANGKGIAAGGDDGILYYFKP